MRGHVPYVPLITRATMIHRKMNRVAATRRWSVVTKSGRKEKTKGGMKFPWMTKYSLSSF